MQFRTFSLVIMALAGVSCFSSQYPSAFAEETSGSLSSALGPDATNLWQFDGDYATSLDKSLNAAALTAGKKGLTLTSKSSRSAKRTFQGWVRLRSEGNTPAVVAIAVGRQNPKDVKDPGIAMTMTSAPATNSILISLFQNGKALIDNEAQSKDLDWLTFWPNSMQYRLKAYNQALPGWDEDFRIRVEHDMSRLPGVNDKWISFRIVMQPGSVEFWVDDRLVTQKQGAEVSSEGFCTFRLSPDAQCARLEDVPVLETPGFVPVPLGGYANGSVFRDGKMLDWKSLPSSGKVFDFQKTPFILDGINPEGNDHLDLSQSFLRQSTQTGYLPAYQQRVGGADQRDPARIQLRIPFKSYKAIHLLAAANGEKNTVPIITVQFYRPGAGFYQNFQAKVPLATAKSTNAKALGVRLIGGKKINLFLVTIPLDQGVLSAFRDLNVFEVELTKNVELWRSYPDPISYGYHPAGFPSGVQIYGLTLEEMPVDFDWSPDNFGHVWTASEEPGYTARLTNHCGAPLSGHLVVSTKSYDGSETHQVEVPIQLPADASQMPFKAALPVKLYGYHDVKATLSFNASTKTEAITWTENRSMVRLAPDHRPVRWTPGEGALFGYWSYHGGHYTPKADKSIPLMTLAGARTTSSLPAPKNLSDETLKLMRQHWTPAQASAWDVVPQRWAASDTLDPEQVAKFQKETLDKLLKTLNGIPEGFKPDHVFYYAEPHISARMTAGNIPEYWGEKPYEPTAEETQNIAMFLNTSKMTSQVVRKEFPDKKILIPYGDPGFSWPLLRAGLSKEYVDGAGIDNPGFERIPERQLHEQSIHRLYFMKKEFEKAGIQNPRLQICEGLFVPTEPGSVSWREQMDIYHRFTLICMAYGIDRFYASWFVFDCGSYYGAEHYGGCGIQRRIPYCDPKPAYAAYATMTDRLAGANFQGWLPTGSLSNYALHFKGPNGHVYALWNLRGKRAVTIKVSGDGKVIATDSMNNSRDLQSQAGSVQVTVDPSVTYITFSNPATQIESIEVGDEDNSDAKQPAGAVPVGDLGDGTWKISADRDTILEKNHWAIMHYPGKFSAVPMTDGARGKVLQTTLLKQDASHELMPWYTQLKPTKPITIPGAPSHLGLWVKGNSDWGRFIYVLRDAKGEAWYSIGEKDQYNCDDVHSWSMFNFDGWRYLRFELPGNIGWDGYRKAGSTWWRFTSEGTVDLPLKLESIIIEQRTHILYVNDIQPVKGNTVQFGKLFAEYEASTDATDAAIRETQIKMPPPIGTVQLNNPITRLEKEGVGAATKLLKLEEPVHYADGTRMQVFFQEVGEATKYYVYCSPYADGAGAVNMAPAGIKNGQLIFGLRPGIPLHYWIVWEDKDKKLSKPSPVHTETLKDNFTQK